MRDVTIWCATEDKADLARSRASTGISMFLLELAAVGVVGTLPLPLPLPLPLLPPVVGLGTEGRQPC